MESLGFKYPYFLLLFVPLFIYIYLYMFRGIGRKRLSISATSSDLLKKRESIKTRTYPYIIYLRLLAIFFLILALAAPGKNISYTSIKNYGLDIIITLDLSGSMSGEDFQPNRLEAAKSVVLDFINKRQNDRIGLVVFAGNAYLQSPLTVDYDIIKEIISDIDFDSVDEDGTAIGDAIALSSSRLMDSNAKGKLILLITDGVNNRGEIDPETAAEACADMNIKIYTVGIGKNGLVEYPNPAGSFFPKQRVLNQFNGESLEKISEITGGAYFRADSSGLFSASMEDIDKLEKSNVEIKIYNEFEDRSRWILILGISLFFIEIILKSIFYRKLP
ncbi:MAG: VWA domain-containing protein [Leptospirales bacterium]|nr:VWA domain-containing protein [Leptospirales bacterium]